MEGGPSIQHNEHYDSVSVSSSFDQQESCIYSCCDPRGTLHRFVALFFMCWVGFGSYFCYDNPAALQNNFISDLNITTTQFSLFYSLYSWPTVIVCFIGGILIDTVFGIRLGANLYMGLTLLGQICFAFGALINSFWLMIAGRFIFGIGAEPLAVAQNNYAVAWFKGKELNMVFGLQLSCARVGSAVNFWVMEPIYAWMGNFYSGHELLGTVLFISTTTCIVSMICSIALGIVDKRAERILRRDENSIKEVIKFKDIKNFHWGFWLLTLMCVTYYVSIFPFLSLGKVFFMKMFNMTAVDANKVNSMVYLVSAFGAPVLGFAIDKLGRNVFWVLIAVLGTTCAHAMLGFLSWSPYFGVILMGISYSILSSSLWPLVTLVIPEHQLGTAYGLCQSIQNLGLALGSFAAGVIIDNYGYVWLEVFFIANLCVCFVSVIVMLVVNTLKKGIMNMTPSQRERYQQSILAAEVLEREKLLSAEVANSASSQALLQPNSDFHIRNRYLSRIGATLPPHYDATMKGLAFRALR